MRLLLLSALTFLTFFIGTYSNANDTACVSEPVIKGIADLRCWDGKSNASLSGKWFFDYQALEGEITYQGLADVPGHWREFEPQLPFLGKGVYRIKLLLPEPAANLALQIKQTHMARKVLLFDERGSQTIIFDSGNTDRLSRSIIKMRAPILHLPKLGKISTLVIHVNNTESINGGIEDAPVLGLETELIRQDQVLKLSTMSISTILAAFFAINFYLWWVRERSYAVLALAGMALLISLRQMVISGIFYEYFPSFSSYFNATVGWGTFLVGLMTGIFYFRSTFPKLIPQWLAIFMYTISFIGVVMYLFWPLYIVQSYGAYYRPMILLSTILIIGFMINGLREPDYELRVTVFSGSIFLLGFVADTLYFHLFEYYPTISITALGMLIFVATQTLMMSRRYWNSIQQTARLATELKGLNTHLEEKVDERTKELASKNEQLITMSRTDPLTGLANRRAFDTMMRKEVRRGERNNKPLVLGMIDLDFFKSVNDNYGHDVGDIILKDTAKLLLDGLRAHDFPARWGGEEFSILLPETDAKEAVMVAERVRKMIENHKWTFGEETLKLTVSFGLAQWEPGRKPASVFKEADRALYEAKEKGRNQVVTFW